MGSDRQALQDVMLRYTAGVDDRDFDLYRSCFADDVEVIGMGPEPIHGADAWLEFVKVALKQYGPTQHMLGPQLATIDGDTAETRNDVQALHTLKRLSRVYRSERRDRGSIDFDLPESRVVLNASGEPTDVQRRTVK